MKRIVFTVTTDLSKDQRMQRICTSIQNAGYDTLLIGRLLKNSQELIDTPYQTKRIKCYFEKGKFMYAEYNLRLFFYLLSLKLDILCSCDADTLLPGVFTKFVKKITLVFDGHEYFSETSGLFGRPLEKKIWQKIERFGIPKCDYAYTVGPILAKIYTNNFGIPFELIRNVPTVKSNTGKTQVPKRLLYQGAINYGRGLEFILPVMKDFDGELIIAGDGPIKKELEERVTELNLTDKVKFTGWINANELKELTETAWIGLNLMEAKGFSYYYSLTNKFFDYIQSNTPQLSINFPEYTDLNKQYNIAHIIDNLNKETILKGLEELSNTNYYNQLVGNTKTAKKELNWENEEKKLIHFYAKL